MADVVLDVVVREDTGTGNARAARREGFIPGILYGGDQDPVAVSLKHNEVLRVLNAGNLIQSMIEISHDGKKQKVLTKDIQFHPVTDRPVHIDFFRVTNDTIIDVVVPAAFVGEDVSPGIKRDFTIATIVSSRASKQSDGEDGEGTDVEGGEAAAAEGDDA